MVRIPKLIYVHTLIWYFIHINLRKRAVLFYLTLSWFYDGIYAVQVVGYWLNAVS